MLESPLAAIQCLLHLISSYLICASFTLVDICCHIGSRCLIEVLVKRRVMRWVNHMVGGQHIAMCANKRTCTRESQWISIATSTISPRKGHDIRCRKMHSQLPAECREYTYHCRFSNINRTHNRIAHVATRAAGCKNTTFQTD